MSDSLTCSIDKKYPTLFSSRKIYRTPPLLSRLLKSHSTIYLSND